MSDRNGDIAKRERVYILSEYVSAGNCFPYCVKMFCYYPFFLLSFLGHLCTMLAVHCGKWYVFHFCCFSIVLTTQYFSLVKNCLNLAISRGSTLSAAAWASWCDAKTAHLQFFHARFLTHYFATG